MADRRVPTAPGALLAVALVLVGIGGCSSDPPTPAEVRHQQVKARLEATFSKKQATCILGAIDDDTAKALVRTAKLDPDSDAFATYSNVVVLCANSDGATTATTTSPASTTTAGG